MSVARTCRRRRRQMRLDKRYGSGPGRLSKKIGGAARLQAMRALSGYQKSSSVA